MFGRKGSREHRPIYVCQHLLIGHDATIKQEPARR